MIPGLAAAGGCVKLAKVGRIFSCCITNCIDNGDCITQSEACVCDDCMGLPACER